MPKQEDLEALSGVSKRTISDIETGNKVPRVSTMRKLENALGLEAGATDDFLAGKVRSLEPRDEATDTEDQSADDEEDDLINVMIDLGKTHAQIDRAVRRHRARKRERNGIPVVHPRDSETR